MSLEHALQTSCRETSKAASLLDKVVPESSLLIDFSGGRGVTDYNSNIVAFRIFQRKKKTCNEIER